MTGSEESYYQLPYAGIRREHQPADRNPPYKLEYRSENQPHQFEVRREEEDVLKHHPRGFGVTDRLNPVFAPVCEKINLG